MAGSLALLVLLMVFSAALAKDFKLAGSRSSLTLEFPARASVKDVSPRSVNMLLPDMYSTFKVVFIHRASASKATPMSVISQDQMSRYLRVWLCLRPSAR